MHGEVLVLRHDYSRYAHRVQANRLVGAFGEATVGDVLSLMSKSRETPRERG